ncbi:MAG: SOS response-associated peptidase [Candidatus Saccharibacteria bacterium]|nr:SOS response-associated peptidase [Pseudorhodobacter sp.]
MCTRITMTYPDEAMAQLFGAVQGNDLPEVPRFNICPTNIVAVVTSDGGRRLRAMRWGFIPAWYKSVSDGPLILNARSETVADKPAFREAVRQRRCIVPASGFYEWSAGPGDTRLPWYFTRTDGAPLALAGLWTRWGDIDSVAVVTGPSGSNLIDIHNREPVVLEPDDWPLWLGEAGHGAATLMRPTAAGILQTYRVGMAVNSVRASGPQLTDDLVE